jgi:hypothetical protein
MKSQSKPVIFVSSTVYGIEELLDRIYTLLTAFGYEVWMSHKGTVPVQSNKTAFENCINAVEKCNLFLCLITPYYGSGIDPEEEVSITHQELQKAIQINKPRWLLAHDHVVFARNFLKNLGYEKPDGRQKLSLKKSQVFGDLRVIDMYEEAIISNVPPRDRQGNWVQKFRGNEDALLFATAQFSRFQEVEAFIQENLSDPLRVSKQTGGKGGRS